MKKSLVKVGVIFSAAVVLSFGLRTYVFARTDVEGTSMMPTLSNNDSTFVEKVSLLMSSFRSGEIIIFDSENANHDLYVKRVIGVAGDEVELINGEVYLNNKKLNEPYLKKDTLTNGGTFLQENEKIKVKNGFVFVLGDNREVSKDSRYFGLVNINTIKGHVILRISHLGKINIFN